MRCASRFLVHGARRKPRAADHRHLSVCIGCSRQARELCGHAGLARKRQDGDLGSIRMATRTRDAKSGLRASRYATSIPVIPKPPVAAPPPNEAAPLRPVRRPAKSLGTLVSSRYFTKGNFTQPKQFAAIRFEWRRVGNSKPLQNLQWPAGTADRLLIRPFAQLLANEPVARLSRFI